LKAANDNVTDLRDEVAELHASFEACIANKPGAGGRMPKRDRAAPLATGPLWFYVVSLRSVRAKMTAPYRIERDRGTRWKNGSPLMAVLSVDQRIALDGAPAETVDAVAKDRGPSGLRNSWKAAKKAAEVWRPPW